MRNVVPRQGTETVERPILTRILKIIEKCSSPTGDGNLIAVMGTDVLLIEKCSSPTGDGNNRWIFYSEFLFGIEKCSSPTGDGNQVPPSSQRRSQD